MSELQCDLPKRLRMSASSCIMILKKKVDGQETHQQAVLQRAQTAVRSVFSR